MLEECVTEWRSIGRNSKAHTGQKIKRYWKKKEEKKKEREREDVMGFPAMNYNAIIFKQNKQEPGKTNVGCQPAQLDVLLAQRFFS